MRPKTPRHCALDEEAGKKNKKRNTKHAVKTRKKESYMQVNEQTQGLLEYNLVICKSGDAYVLVKKILYVLKEAPI